MNAQFSSKRVSTRKSCTETSQLMSFLTRVLESEPCKQLYQALGEKIF